jgi:hypothetical protein
MSLETTLSLIAAGISIVVAVSSVWATYRAPVHALRIQRMLDEAKERSGRKLWIYKTLMSNRATRLKLEFVQALNLIDIEFLEPGEKGVRDAWKELNDHYTDWGAKTEERKKAESKADIERANVLLNELLLTMVQSLGYPFDRVAIKKGFYYPEGLMNIEQEQHALRGAVLNLLSGKGVKLPVAVFEQKFGQIAVEPLRENGRED